VPQRREERRLDDLLLLLGSQACEILHASKDSNCAPFAGDMCLKLSWRDLTSLGLDRLAASGVLRRRDIDKSDTHGRCSRQIVMDGETTGGRHGWRELLTAQRPFHLETAQCGAEAGLGGYHLDPYA